MTDRLTEIMALAAQDAWRMLDGPTRADLVAAHQGSLPEARAQAFTALSEPVRLAFVRSAGLPPEACGPELAVAPARGPLRIFDVLEPYPDGEHGTRLRPAGFQGRKTAQLADAFDRMRAQAERRRADAPFSASQIGMGRIYATLIRDRDSGGMHGCWPTGGGTGGGRMDGYTEKRIAAWRRIDLLQAKIGTGTAMPLRRIRPSRRAYGAPRRPITDRALVDAVCLDDLTISEALAAHGWSVWSDHIVAASRALAVVLDRMIGGPNYRD